MAALSPETSLLITALKKAWDCNQFLSYTYLEEIVPGCKGKNRYFLASALSHLKKEYKCLFKVHRGEGYQPLRLEGEKLKTIESDRQNKIRRQAQRWREELGTVATVALSKTETQEYTKQVLYLSAHEMALSPSYSDKVAAIAQNTSGRISYSLEAVKAIADVS